MLEHFYHGTIRKVVVGFATLFNNIYVSRRNESGQEIERIKVPLAYGPQQKFLRRLDRIGTAFEQQAVRLENYLPRMSFEIGNLQYDSTRKLNSVQRTYAYYPSDTSKLRTRYERVPYNMTMNLGVMTKGMEDCLYVVEQILPYFTPEYVFTIRAIDGMDENVDIPIVFSSVSLTEGDDGSQGDYSTRKVNIASMSFVAKLYLYGPVKVVPFVSDTNINIFDTKDVGLTAETSQKLSEIDVSKGAGLDASNYDPSLTPGEPGITHTSTSVSVEPPIQQ